LFFEIRARDGRGVGNDKKPRALARVLRLKIVEIKKIQNKNKSRTHTQQMTWDLDVCVCVTRMIFKCVALRAPAPTILPPILYTTLYLLSSLTTYTSIPPIMCFCYIHSPSFRRSSYILEQSKVRVCCPIFLGRQPCVNVTIILIIHDCRQLFSPVAADDGNLLKTKRN
jgi:hypothetical protein